MTILVVIVVGVILMRRRANRRSLHAAVNVRLDPTATPEERHIASMQMTGYENPTYKYFESSGTASAWEEGTPFVAVRRRIGEETAVLV